MAGYSRKTILNPAAVLALAEEDLPKRLGLRRVRSSAHGASYSGEEGAVRLSMHRHSQYTVVTTSTDQLRTSRMDYEIQRFLNLLPYEHGDQGGRGSGDPN